MNTDQVVVVAAVAAAVASTVTLSVQQMRKARETKEYTLQVIEAQQKGYTRGWFEGRESVLQQLTQTAPGNDFAIR